MEHGLLYENVMNIKANAIAPNTGVNGQTGLYSVPAGENILKKRFQKMTRNAIKLDSGPLTEKRWMKRGLINDGEELILQVGSLKRILG